jgi:hypothetical protein
VMFPAWLSTSLFPVIGETSAATTFRQNSLVVGNISLTRHLHSTNLLQC